jgi:hypothetical protein
MGGQPDSSKNNQKTNRKNLIFPGRAPWSGPDQRITHRSAQAGTTARALMPQKGGCPTPKKKRKKEKKKKKTSLFFFEIDCFKIKKKSKKKKKAKKKKKKTGQRTRPGCQRRP